MLISYTGKSINKLKKHSKNKKLYNFSKNKIFTFIIMANRRGTFLSDENIKKMCPSHFAPSGALTYQLFQTPTATKGYRTQRPNRPYKMMEMMAQQQGVPYNALNERFRASIPMIENEGIAVISTKENLKNVAQPQPTQSRPQIVATGKAKSLLSTESGTDILSLVSTTSYGAGSSVAPMNPLLGLGNLGSQAQQFFNGLNRPDRVSIYKTFYQDAENAGIDFKGTQLSFSAIERVPGGLPAQSRLFGQLEGAIYQAMGATAGQQFIDQMLQMYLGVPQQSQEPQPPATPPPASGEGSPSRERQQSTPPRIQEVAEE